MNSLLKLRSQFAMIKTNLIIIAAIIITTAYCMVVVIHSVLDIIVLLIIETPRCIYNLFKKKVSQNKGW